MAVYPFGKDDILVLTSPSTENPLMGSDSLYTKMHHHWHYSKHGFAYPLDNKGIPFAIFMEDALTRLPDHIRRTDMTYCYLLIDHDKNIWTTAIDINKGLITFTQNYIHQIKDVYWISASNDDYSFEAKSLLGLLYTNPSKKTLDDFALTYLSAETLEYHSINQIVETLKKIYPRDLDHVDPDLLREARKLVNKMITQSQDGETITVDP